MLRTEEDVMTNLEYLSKRSSWNPDAKFLVFVDWLERDWSTFIRFIIEKFWSVFVIDVVICIPTAETDAQTKVLSQYLLLYCDLRSLYTTCWSLVDNHMVSIQREKL